MIATVKVAIEKVNGYTELVITTDQMIRLQVQDINRFALDRDIVGGDTVRVFSRPFLSEFTVEADTRKFREELA